MATKQTQSSFLTVRLTPKKRKAFSVKATEYGGPTYVLRELVEAFIENRLTVQPSPTKRSLYHES